MTIDDVAAIFRIAMRRLPGRRGTITISRTEDNRYFIQGDHKGAEMIDVTRVSLSEFRKAHPIGY